MSSFVTGATGFLGGYALVELLAKSPDPVTLMVRGTSESQAREKLWKGLQLHMGKEQFLDEVLPRVHVVLGDLHAPALGLSDTHLGEVRDRCDAILHIAASLNRKSAKACLNTNLRGTLSVIKLARALADGGGLRRYSHVSTVAVSGHRHREVVFEDTAIDWDRSDYDPYGRTKKFCEHMAHELLPDVQRTIFRPPIVMGDSRHPRTTQFDMVQATVTFGDLPFVPLRPTDRVDIVPADWLARALIKVHLEADPAHEIYHLSAGTGACTAQEIVEAIKAAIGRGPRFAPRLAKPFDWTFRGLNRLPRGSSAQAVGAVMKVFMPYVVWDTVFDNTRIVEATGEAPPRFSDYGPALYRWAKGNRFRFPHEPL